MALNPAPALLLSLPSEGIFDTFKLLYDHCQEHAKLASYAFVIGRTDKKYGLLVKTLIYERGVSTRTKPVKIEFVIAGALKLAVSLLLGDS